MAWNYSELSKMAKNSGGPEKLIDILVKSGEKKVLPWVGVAFAGGIALTVGVQKAISSFSKKKAISTAEVKAPLVTTPTANVNCALDANG